MSISFSGLASGLDTSSWVESLTALKRAKVETYKTEKQNLLLSKQTLSSIKSFFNSFRSVIERVTDTRFGVGHLDLFAQNLAISSKANVLTATANTTAKEGSYTIEVNNLASNTQASSRYTETVAQTIVTTATLASSLDSLGVEAGKIGINVDGTERYINISNNETIQSFIKKLDNIGVEANYDEKTGSFSINLSTGDIHDIGNTGIVEALHLKGVNGGFTSYNISIPTTETVYETATLGTKLSELGVGEGSIYIKNGDSPFTNEIAITENTTIGDFINTLNENGFSASFTDGCITLSNALIVDDTIGLCNAFGWSSPEISSITQTSKALSYSSTTTETTVANRNSLLKDLGGNVSINDGDTIIVKNLNNEISVITLSQSSTIGNVLDELNNAGLSASIDSDGIVTINNGTILGGTFDLENAFHLTETITGTSASSSGSYITCTTTPLTLTSAGQVTYNESRIARMDDRIINFVDPEFIGEDGKVHCEVALFNAGGGAPITTYNITGPELFSDLIGFLNYYGFDATLDSDGVLTVNSSDGKYVAGLDIFGVDYPHSMGGGTFTYTVGNTQTTYPLTYEVDKVATESDTISSFIGMTLGKFQICDSQGRYLETFTPTDSWTFGTLLDELNASSEIKSATLVDGVLTIEADNCYIKGLGQLGIVEKPTTIESVVTTAYADLTSTIAITYTTDIVTTTTAPVTTTLVSTAVETRTVKVGDSFMSTDKIYTTSGGNITGNTKLSELGNLGTASDGNIRIYFNDADDNLTYIGLSKNDTLDTLVNKLEEYGFSARISSGQIEVTQPQDGSYRLSSMYDDLAEALHIDMSVASHYTEQTIQQTIYTTTTVPATVTITTNVETRTAIVGKPVMSTAQLYTTSGDAVSRDTKLEEIGNIASLGNSDLRIWLRDIDNNQTSIQFYKDDTFSTFMEKLEDYGFTVSFASGSLYITPPQDGSYRIDTMNEDFAASLNLPLAGLEDCSSKTVTRTIYTTTTAPATETITTVVEDYTAKVGNSFSSTTNIYTTSGDAVNWNTKLVDIGNFAYLGGPDRAIFLLDENDRTTVVGLDENDTLGTLKQKLEDYGFSVSMSTGILEITQPNDGSYRIGTIYSDLAECLHIDAAEATGYRDVLSTRTIYTTTTNATTETITTTTTQTITADSNTKLKDILGDDSTGLLNIVINTFNPAEVQFGNPNSGNHSEILTFNLETATIGSVLDTLTAKGFDVSITDGKITISGNTENKYIQNVQGPLADAFNLDRQTSKKYDFDDTVIYKTDTIRPYRPATEVADENTTYGQIDDTERYIEIYSNGNLVTVTCSETRTLDSIFAELNYYGIKTTMSDDGCVDFTGSTINYVTNFGGAFGIDVDGYDVVESPNTPSRPIAYNIPHTINDDTTLSQLNENFVSGSFSIVRPDAPDIINTIEFTADTTLLEMKNQLAANGIDFSYTDGNVTFTSLDGSYIKQTEGGILHAFRIYSVQTYQVNRSAINEDTKLSEIHGSNGNPLNISSGEIYVNKNGITNTISINPDQTIGDLQNQLGLYGIEMKIGTDGSLELVADENTYLTDHNGPTSTPSNLLDVLGLQASNWQTHRTYESSQRVNSETLTSEKAPVTTDAKLSDLNITSGEYYIYQNGVKNTVHVSSDDTIGDFINTLNSYGIEADITGTGDGTTSILTLHSDANNYIASSNSVLNASNIVDVLFGDSNPPSTNYSYVGNLQTQKEVTSFSAATKDTLLSNFDKDGKTAEGSLEISINGETSIINIDSSETFGSLIDKLNAIGLNASLTNGDFVIQSGFDTIEITGGTSDIVDTLGLNYNPSLGGYSATEEGQTVNSTRVIVDEMRASVANYANYDTKLELLNISNGTLTLYRNGEKATIQVDKEKTLGDLRADIASKFADTDLTFENGHLVISSTGGDVVVGATTDTSNFSAITGITTNSRGQAVSSRSLYCVNNSSIITNEGLFVRGTVTEGDFYVGNARIEINDKTTLNDIISQINYSEESQATAFWDSVEGRFVIKAKTTGASLINIEAGTSNFTDIMGFTQSDDGTSRMIISTQELGKNARFSINGTNFTSTSNTVTSDISRIEGVTIYLKNITEGEPVTLTIEKDKETAATAVSDIVDAYNELITNIDKEVTRGASLEKESTLKLIRNQIRSLMTGSHTNSGHYKTMSSIGISLAAATTGNIRTDNINELYFDKDKFINAFAGDIDSIKSLLVGTDENKGILTRVESVLEQALGGVTGYFASAEKSYTNKISNIDNKITKTNSAADRYKVRLESKFKAMDMIISKFQNQYSSFLG